MPQKPVVKDDCIACGICFSVCPAEPNVFEIEDIAKVVHPEACIDGCTECADNCPTNSIEIQKE